MWTDIYYDLISNIKRNCKIYHVEYITFIIYNISDFIILSLENVIFFFPSKPLI